MTNTIWPFCLLLLALVIDTNADITVVSLGTLKGRASKVIAKARANAMAKELETKKEAVTSSIGRRGNNLQVLNRGEDEKTKRLHTTQTFEGNQVWGYETTTITTKAGVVRLTDKKTGAVIEKRLESETYRIGNFVDGLDVALKREGESRSKLTSEQLLKKFQFTLRGTTDRRRKRDTPIALPDDVFVDNIKPIVYIIEEAGRAIKAHLIKVFVDNGFTYEHRIVDGSGKVLEAWDGLQTASPTHKRLKRQTPTTLVAEGGNEKSGKITYGKDGIDPLSITRYGDLCFLSNPDVQTVHFNGAAFPPRDPRGRDALPSTTFLKSTDPQATTPFGFKCDERGTDDINGGFSPLNDAHYGATKFSQMIRDWYKVAPLKKMPIIVRVHFALRFDNAFRDDRSGVNMGDGSKVFHPTTSFDMLAHEIAHSITAESSNLVYRREHGGMNEAFSDMAAMALQRYLFGYNASTFDWGMFGSITKRQKGPHRCMDNPKCDKRSLDHVKSYRRGMGVHHISGIYNKVFSEMSKGLANDVWDAFDVMYVANTRFWQSRTKWLSGAELVLKAAEELNQGKHLQWNYNLNMDVIKNAFNTVGIKCTKKSDKKTEWKCRK